LLPFCIGQNYSKPPTIPKIPLPYFLHISMTILPNSFIFGQVRPTHLAPYLSYLFYSLTYIFYPKSCAPAYCKNRSDRPERYIPPNT
jgi:hypothetical protein